MMRPLEIVIVLLQGFAWMLVPKMVFEIGHANDPPFHFHHEKHEHVPSTIPDLTSKNEVVPRSL